MKTGERPEKLVFVSGISHGVWIQGWLPESFRDCIRRGFTTGQGAPWKMDVSYERVGSLPEVEAFWVGTAEDPRAESRFTLFRESEGFGLKIECQGRGLFRIGASRIDIEWLPGGTDAAHYFFSQALPLWLEWQGVPVLHASAVGFCGRVAGFLGRSGAGKSTLCRALVQMGCDFITDDSLPAWEDDRGLWHCAPGPLLFRLWPSALVKDPRLQAGQLQPVHRKYEKRLVPLTPQDGTATLPFSELAAIYVLERRSDLENDIQLVPCTGNEKLVRLVEYSLVHAPANALGWTSDRLRRLARLAERTRIQRLVYSSGAEHLKAVRDVIVQDLDAD